MAALAFLGLGVTELMLVKRVQVLRASDPWAPARLQECYSGAGHGAHSGHESWGQERDLKAVITLNKPESKLASRNLKRMVCKYFIK